MSNGLKNLLGLISLGLAGFLFWMLAAPNYDRYNLLSDEVKQRKEFLESRKELISDINGLGQEFKERKSDVDKLASILPKKRSTAELLSALDTISSRAGVSLIEATFSEVKETKQTYAATQINTEVAGNYLAFKNFLDMAEKNLRLIDIGTIVANSDEQTGQIRFRIKMNAYYIND